MTDGAARTNLRLPSELVALIHHVELSAAGWRDDLLDQLVLSSMFLQASPCRPEELGTSLVSDFGLTTDDSAFRRSVERLLASQQLVEVTSGRLKLAESAVAAIEKAIVANKSLEERVAARFKALVVEEASEVDPDDCWLRFRDECLDPLVTELGARTYELIAVPVGGGPDIQSITAYIDSYSPSVRKTIQDSIDRFLDPSDIDVRSFVLSRLHSHFLTLAASLSEQSLADLAAKRKSNLQLKLFLDTNFLFSVLDLHDNPANAVARDLIRLLGEVKEHVRSKLYVFPLTLDEVTRTLSGFRGELSNVEVDPRLGRIAMNTRVGRGSGIRARFLRAVASSTHRLTAQDYFSPYIANLVAVLRGYGLEPYNAKVEALTKSQPVIDDILAQKQFESSRPHDRQKSYEALRHDVTLWHFASSKRSDRVDSPLDAVFWVVTVDHSLLRFDRHKTKNLDNVTVPICVHPAVLVQMLQLWLPRTPQFDETMLQCVRALLPHPHDTDVEVVTLRILRTLSRFEEANDFPEEAVSAVILNRAVSDRMRGTTEADDQDRVVRDALVHELAADKEKRRAETEEKIRGTRERANEVERENRKIKAATEQLQAKLQDEQQARQDLENRLLDLEGEKQAHEAEVTRQRDFQRQLHRASFVTLALLLFVPAVAVITPGAGWLGDLTGYQGRRTTTIVMILAVTLWTLLVDCAGSQFQNVSNWKRFNTFRKLKTWLFWLFGTIIAGLLTMLIWER